jgi:hypothetical protein
MGTAETDVGDALDALLELSAAAHAARGAAGGEAEAAEDRDWTMAAAAAAAGVVEALRDSVMDAMGQRHMSGAPLAAIRVCGESDDSGFGTGRQRKDP